MEKFQKYCLSVILVIIYSNVYAQINIETIENIGCEKLCEMYKHSLSESNKGSLTFSSVVKKRNDGLLSQRRMAIDALKNSEIQTYNDDRFLSYFELGKYDKVLKNFEKQDKQNDFAKNVGLKSKVAKIRNKDDLDLKIKLRTLRWKS